MNIHILVPGLAVVLQLVSVLFAIRLMRYAERRVIGFIFVLATCLMAVRRVVSLLRASSPGGASVDLTAETIALTISFLILCGMIAVARVFKANEDSKHAAVSADARYRTFFNQSPDGVLLMDAEGNIVDYNEAVNRQLGYTREEFGRLKIADIDPVESPADISARFEKVLREEKDEFEVKHRTKSGDIRDVLVIIQRLELTGKTFFHAIWRDITGQRQSERRLLESEERFRLAMQGANDGLWDWDIKTDEVYYSPRWKSMLGYAETELESSFAAWKQVCHPDDLERSLAFVHDFLAGRTDKYELEFRLRHKDGRYLDILSRASLVRGADGGPLRLVGTHLDITERRKSEEKIRQSEEFIRNMLDTVDEGFIVVDRDYRILTANKAYCSQVGVSAGQVIGSHCYEISHKTGRPCYEAGEDCAVRQVFETGNPQTSLHRHEDARGNILYVEAKAFPIRDASGNILSAIETINNITEKHLLEEERLRTQKLESIGTLAGGIAHDFNNLLQGVFGYISLAKVTHDQKEKSLAMLEQAEEALHMSVNLTTQLLTFSKGGKPVKKLVSIRPSIENAVKFALSGSHTSYALEAPADLWPVEADEGQLTQVIHNIVLNANEAMSGRGIIQISLANVAAAGKTVRGLQAGGPFVCIAIQDSGSGITEQDMVKIFDPYFTTKQKGSGLGLATSYSIIKNHGGTIEVTSDVNKGTTFEIYLPASPAAVEETAAPVSVPVRDRKARILLMDDEELVRNVAREMIASLGHEVVSAEDGRQAVDLFRQSSAEGKPFDLVILDLTVKGGMGGEEAIRNILELTPGAKAVVSSGYADSPIVADYQAYGFSAVLSKPYRISSLQSCISQLLRIV